jgi:hypothetical protein
MANVNDILEESLDHMPESLTSLIVEFSLERNPICDELDTDFTDCPTCDRRVQVWLITTVYDHFDEEDLDPIIFDACDYCYTPP